MKNKTFDAVVKAICGLIKNKEADDSGDYTLTLSKTSNLKEFPRKDIFESIERLELHSLILPPGGKDDDIFNPKNSDQLTFQISEHFESWYRGYERQNNLNLSSIPTKKIQEMLAIAEEISGEIALLGSTSCEITSSIRDMRAKADVLNFLFSNHCIHSYNATPGGFNVRVRENYLRNLQKFRKEIKSLLMEPSVNSHLNKKVASIPLPPGTKWEDITIEFVDGHNVKIKCGGKTNRADYKDMGFEDTRKHKPDAQWELLQALAKKHGQKAWGDSPSDTTNMSKTDQAFFYDGDDDSTTHENKKFSILNKNTDEIKKTKQILAKRLKAYFQIDDDPFWPYKKVSAYIIKIKLIPS